MGKNKFTLVPDASARTLRDQFVRAGTMRQEGQLREAAAEFDRVIALAQAAEDREIEGRATHGRGIVEERRDNYALAKTYYDQALAIAREIRDDIGAGLVLTDLAWVYQHWDMHDLAMEHARDALDVLLATPEEHVAFHRMGTLLADSGRYQAALEFFDKAISSVQSSPEASSSPIQAALELNYAWSASMHLHLGDAVLAKEVNLKALDLARALNDRINVANLTAKIGYCEMELGNFPAAQERIRLACELYRAEGRLSNLASCLTALADLEVRSGHPTDALTTLASASKYLEESGSKRSEWRLHETYAKAYEAVEDWRMVVHHVRERQRSRQERDSGQFGDKLNAAQILIATQRERHALEVHQLLTEKLEQQIASQLVSTAAQSELVELFLAGVRDAARKFTDPINALKEIQAMVRALPRQEIDWTKFEAEFAAVHPKFKAKLAQDYPDLTQMEQRIAAMIRMELKSSDIARLFSITERAVEFHRLNLRKKLNLKAGETLPTFLSQL